MKGVFMNTITSYSNTSFGSAYINPKGAEKFCKRWNSEMINKFVKTVEKAKQSKENHIILDENGTIKLRNEEYGEFVTNNPANKQVNNNVFSCDIRTNEGEGEVKRFYLEMPDEVSARKLGDSFAPGTLVPEDRMDLFDAMEAASNYKKAIIEKLIKFSD